MTDNNEEITVGDIVHVDCNNGQTTISHRAVVKHKACATGDSWQFKCLDTGDVIYCSEGITITKRACS